MSAVNLKQIVFHRGIHFSGGIRFVAGAYTFLCKGVVHFIAGVCWGHTLFFARGYTFISCKGACKGPHFSCRGIHFSGGIRFVAGAYTFLCKGVVHFIAGVCWGHTLFFARGYTFISCKGACKGPHFSCRGIHFSGGIRFVAGAYTFLARGIHFSCKGVHFIAGVCTFCWGHTLFLQVGIFFS